MFDCSAAARHLLGRRCRRTAVLPARIGAVVVVLALVAGTAACVLPPPPPPPSATEFVDPIYVYDPASTCRDAVITAPFVGPESCGAVVSITESLQQQRMADADAALTAGDQQTARQLAIDTGYRPEAADIYRPTGASGLRPAVVYLHPGAWIRNDKSTADNFAGEPGYGPELARRGFVTVAVDYTLSTLAHAFTLAEQFDGVPDGEPADCATIDDPHPGQPDAFDPVDCYDAAIAYIASHDCASGVCPSLQAAVRISIRGSIDAYLSAERTVQWIRANAAPLGVDPSQVFVVGEAAGSVTAAMLTHEVWRAAGSPDAASGRVLAGAGVAGYELADDATYATLAWAMHQPDQPGLPDLGLDPWSESGGAGPADPPFRAFMTEGDVVYGVAKPAAALRLARAAGADDGIYWTCGQAHAITGADRALLFAETGRVFRRAMGLATPESLTAAEALLPSSEARSWPLRHDRQPVHGRFRAASRDDVYFYGPGNSCDSLWQETPDPTGGSAPSVYVPFTPGAVQREGSSTVSVADTNSDGHDDLIFSGPSGPDNSIWLNPP